MEKIIQQKNWRLQRKRGRRGERKKGGREEERGGREKGEREKERGGREERINQEMERIISLTVASVSTNVSILIIRKSFELGG